MPSGSVHIYYGDVRPEVCATFSPASTALPPLPITVELQGLEFSPSLTAYLLPQVDGMSDFAFNVWGAVASAIGVLTIVPTFMYLFLCRLPSAKYRVLKITLKEVEQNFEDALKQGLIRPSMTSIVSTTGCGGKSFNSASKDLIANHVYSIQVRFDDLSEEVENIKSWREELTYWYDGFSTRISFVYDEVIELRKLIARRSSRERRALIAAGIPSRLAEMSSKREHFAYVGSGFMLHLPREPSTDLPRYRPSPSSSGGHQTTATDNSRAGTHVSSSPEPPAYDDMRAPSSHSAPCNTAPPAAPAKSQACHCCGATNQGRRRLDWDADLTELLSAILVHACRADKGKHDNQLCREMLRRFGTKLLEGLDEPCDNGAGAPAKQDGASLCHTSAATSSVGEKSSQDTVCGGEHE
ncbi:hypothetical protein GY45DRAFT_1376404 [Cubamyces sp. BRFM 1775]|nr:hypothetical protein GY45DRAFT_1376404 [Cubamyces sp. BRFM 1775]